MSFYSDRRARKALAGAGNISWSSRSLLGSTVNLRERAQPSKKPINTNILGRYIPHANLRLSSYFFYQAVLELSTSSIDEHLIYKPLFQVSPPFLLLLLRPTSIILMPIVQDIFRNAFSRRGIL